MARLLYGDSPADVLAQVTADPIVGNENHKDLGVLASTAVSAWTALVGGTQITDLRAVNLTTGAVGAAISSVTTTPTGRALFFGPDGYTNAIWLQDPAGARWRIDPSELASRTSTGLTGVIPDANLPEQLRDENIGPVITAALAAAAAADLSALVNRLPPAGNRIVVVQESTSVNDARKGGNGTYFSNFWFTTYTQLPANYIAGVDRRFIIP